MLLPVQKVLRLISVRSGTSKAGNPYAMVKLADEETFDSETFKLSREQSADFLQLQARYKVTIEKEGDFVSVSLEPEKQKAS